MKPRAIRTRSAPVDADVRVPGSKSVTHRALIAAALAGGRSSVIGPLVADDTIATRDGLRALGFAVEDAGDRWRVEGLGGRVPGGGVLDLEQSGSSMRFLAAMAALGERPSVLDGHPRLRERPMGGLYAALRILGARVRPPGDGRSLPCALGGAPLSGGTVTVPGDRSSQFVSALLLIGARVAGGVTVEVPTGLVSAPYVAVTTDVLAAFGVPVDRSGATFRVGARAYPGREYAVEGDHSSASCLFAAALVAGGRLRVRGLRPDSAQPDARMIRLLQRLGADVVVDGDAVAVRAGGAVPAFEEDLGEAPDLTPAVAVLALVAAGPCRLTGIAHLQFKESDRLAVLAENLTALGRPTRVEGGALHVGPPSRRGPEGVRIRTAGDHRMAMAFAVAGLVVPGVEIDDPGCVAKSFPGFWDAFAHLEGTSTR
jgi:3-phosphoshikimate 1-carboxyvinyltransferase